MITLHVGTPESDDLFRDTLWRYLKRLDPPEEIFIRWPDGRRGERRCPASVNAAATGP